VIGLLQFGVTVSVQPAPGMITLTLRLLPGAEITLALLWRPADWYVKVGPGPVLLLGPFAVEVVPIRATLKT
jgi:hypothetical protein